jgi:nitrite reductase (NADH) small subunit
MAEVFVCRSGELKEGAALIVPIDPENEVGVYRHAGRYYAYRNRCLHQGGPVCEGLLLPKVEDVLGPDRSWLGQRFNEGEMHIVCPWHSYEFKLETGESATDPSLRLKRYDVIEREGAVYVVV